MTTYNKNIFDYKSLPDNVKTKLKLNFRSEDTFKQKIYNIFDLAKKQNLTQLSHNQVAVAYYRIYTAKNPTDFKTLNQIQGKLYSISRVDSSFNTRYNNQPNSSILIKRVPNEKNIFTIQS